MIQTTVKNNIASIQSLLYPFKYKEILIYAGEVADIPGLYGTSPDNLFFIPASDLPEEFLIEIPDNLEELQDYVASIEFIVQKIAMNPKSKIPNYDGETTHLQRVKPFMDFMLGYEKGLKIIEGLKNGII